MTKSGRPMRQKGNAHTSSHTGDGCLLCYSRMCRLFKQTNKRTAARTNANCIPPYPRPSSAVRLHHKTEHTADEGASLEGPSLARAASGRRAASGACSRLHGAAVAAGAFGRPAAGAYAPTGFCCAFTGVLYAHGPTDPTGGSLSSNEKAGTLMARAWAVAVFPS